MHSPHVSRPQRRPDPHPAVLRPSTAGHPLPAPVQAKMEGALGHDFGNVRVHRGEEAGSIGAAAFTRGSHIHFAPGRYNPHSAAGQRLLAHELAHVVQQRAGRVAMPGGAVPINADARLEAEADALGARAARGEAAAGGPPAGPARAAPVGHGSMQPMWVTIKNGKVHYDWSKDNKKASRPSGEHVWMEPDEFVQFKNAGKRTASNKWSHKVTGAKYYSTDGAKFYSDPQMQTPMPQAPQTADLIDRRRKDRSTEAIALYDISDYATAKKYETVGDHMEHDHVLAGESKKRRFAKEQSGFTIPLAGRQPMLGGVKSAEEAYASAPSIEIRGRGHHEGWDHHDYSSTWGFGRQSNEDTAVTGGKSYKLGRPDMDAELPEAAFHRDAHAMLANSPQRGDKLIQAGAYRKLYKTNISRKVVNPGTQGFTYTGNPLTNKGDGGGITYTEVSHKTQGELTDAMLREHLAARVKAAAGV